MKKSFLLLSILLISGFGMSSAFAHTTIYIDQYEIEAGWGDEPPVVNLPNKIVIEVAESGEKEGLRIGVNSAFKSMTATLVAGGATKELDINSDPRPGHYYAKILPTKTGSMSVKLVGELNGLPIDVVIPIEDVESQSVIAFPPVSGSSSAGEISAVKNALSSLQKDVSNIKSNVGEVSLTAGGVDIQNAYNFGVFGLSLGAAGVILAVIAMLRRK
ncbi:hypothetical protein OAJ67_01305 [Candidatus Nitrosopelagicus sp.]|nr:hypothetical protein [Candidatus Nitrosopelagicus sp.]MDC0203382.1 hypothetical protein [Candidatus Nitrosopelagicus sp.]